MNLPLHAQFFGRGMYSLLLRKLNGTFGTTQTKMHSKRLTRFPSDDLVVGTDVIKLAPGNALFIHHSHTRPKIACREEAQ